ncbi:NUDIX hydrolase [Cryptosporangium phraense]|uniref:NUDIX domain-containing protein n=1 Tax=Cryptosporangium phraense TaxID=2593070 RepID=A0A545AWC4_9ACTN|nr:NUDIX domain-containing protein [Cryptosporangium phraense]TQS45624.1 NUDIX domain-containing protein [Cryptosporangium phraense]
MRAFRRFAVVPAAYVVLRRDDGRILLQRRQNTGYLDGHWAVGAAGHVEAGESVLDAARREAQEELGIAVDDLRPITVMHRTVGTARIDQRVDFFFECRRWTGEPERREPDRAAELRWVSPDELPTPVVPHERWVLENWRDGDIPAVTTFGFSTVRRA